AHDRRGDPQDDLRLIGHDDGVDLALAVLDPVINPGSADGQRKILIVDYGDKVRRVELGRAGGAGDATDRDEGGRDGGRQNEKPSGHWNLLGLWIHTSMSFVRL